MAAVRRPPVERVARRAAHERVRELREQLGGRRSEEPAPEGAADRDVQGEPELRALRRIERHLALHPRPGVEVDQVRRSARVGEAGRIVGDELEPARRARERLVLERGDERLARHDRERASGDDRDVDVAAPRPIVAEGGRPHEAHGQEVAAEHVARAGDDLRDVGGRGGADPRLEVHRGILPDRAG
jgi:hypothetical protein